MERVEQLEPDPLPLIERVEQVILHRPEPASLPQLLASFFRPPARPAVRPSRLLRLAGRNREGLWCLAQEAGGVVPHVADDLVSLFGPGENVDLVYDEDDLLAPLPDLLQEAALALG